MGEDETEGNCCGCGCGCLALSQCSLASQPEAEPGMFWEAEPVTEEAEAAAEA